MATGLWQKKRAGAPAPALCPSSEWLLAASTARDEDTHQGKAEAAQEKEPAHGDSGQRTGATGAGGGRSGGGDCLNAAVAAGRWRWRWRGCCGGGDRLIRTVAGGRLVWRATGRRVGGDPVVDPDRVGREVRAGRVAGAWGGAGQRDRRRGEHGRVTVRAARGVARREEREDNGSRWAAQGARHGCRVMDRGSDPTARGP